MNPSWLRAAILTVFLIASCAAGQSTKIGDWLVSIDEATISDWLGPSMMSYGVEWPVLGTSDMPLLSFHCSNMNALGVNIGFSAGRNLGHDDRVKVTLQVDDAPQFTDHWEIISSRSRLVPPMQSMEALLPRLIGSSMLRIEVVVPRKGLFFRGGTYQYGFRTGGFTEAFRALGCYNGSVAQLVVE